MKPYAELLYYNQLNPNTSGHRRIRDTFRLKEPEDIIEFAGRWDYGEKNAKKLGEKSKMLVPRRTGQGTDPETGEPVTVVISENVEVPIIQKYLAMGHESMIEMGDATFFIECSRVVSHELVRHRLASFQQESQRFVKYDDVNLEEDFYYPDGLEGKDGIWFLEDPGEFIEPVNIPGYVINPGIPAEDAVLSHYGQSVELYQQLRAKGVAPQDARYVLPNGFKTRIIMKANVRQWRHICRLRLDRAAQPEMQELMRQIYDQLVGVYPNAMHGVLEGDRGVR